MRRVFLRWCLVVAIFFSHSANSEFLPEPNIKWTYTLPEAGTIFGRSLRRGNGVVISKDSSRLFVTADDGSLHIIYPDALQESVSFIPTSLQGTFTECQSSVALYENPNVQYVVYAVMDTPVVTNVGMEEVTSRIIAVNPDGSMRWTVLVEGYVAGTPVISSDGSKVFVSCNTDTGGLVKVIGDNDDNGNAKVIADLFSVDHTAPFTPVTLREVSPGKDYVFVAESTDDGFALEGNIFFIDESLELRVFSVWERSAVHRPIVSNDGDSLWMGGTGSVVAGWGIDAGGPPFSPRFEEAVQPSRQNASQPLSNAPIVTSDNKMLCMNSESFDLVCIDAEDGGILWVYKIRNSAFNVEPKFSEISGENTVLYTIETLTGRVRQHDAQSGVLNWAFDCTDVSGNASCQDSVEAEFSISEGGNVVYYGDIFGKIVALQVAEFATKSPTTSPSQSPTVDSESPTLSPEGSPSVAPSSIAPVPVVEENDGGSISSPSPSSKVVDSGAESSSSSAPTKDDKDTDLFYSPPNGSKESNSSFSGTDKLLYSAVAMICILIFLVFGLLFLCRSKKKEKRRPRKSVNETFDSDEEFDGNGVLDLVTIEHHASRDKKRHDPTPQIDAVEKDEESGQSPKTSAVGSSSATEEPRIPFPTKKSIRVKALSSSRRSNRTASPSFPLASIEEADNESTVSDASSASSVPQGGIIAEITALARKSILGKEEVEDETDPLEDELVIGRKAEYDTPTNFFNNKTAVEQDNVKITAGASHSTESDDAHDSEENVEILATLGGSLVHTSTGRSCEDSVSDISNVSVRKEHHVNNDDSSSAAESERNIPTTITTLPVSRELSSVTMNQSRSTGTGSSDESSKIFGQSLYKRKTTMRKPSSSIRSKQKKKDDNECDDPWGAFLGKLAKAEEDFFNPSLPSPSIDETDKHNEEKKDESPNDGGRSRPHSSVSAPAYAFL
mmetsp:Transcript_57/g.115  ORF Transcript_57/g.115 Transcript_57/m.115 type:complete len:954 (+) Transcript_57:137-2998(+)